MSQVKPHSLFTDFDIALFQSGKHFRLWEKLGSHPMILDGELGTHFAVWAPNAKKVAVTGSFNGWKGDSHVLNPRWDSSGIWEGFIPGIGKGTVYKYRITTPDGKKLDKGDPFAMLWETPPATASIVWTHEYRWNDADWQQKQLDLAGKPRPWSVYEVHLGSWKKLVEDGNRSLNYRELAVELVNYVKEMGFTHIEMMPVMEHPYFPSWGYQIGGYFAPTSRFGNPEDLMAMIDACHQANVGVILDWVPSHFPGDIHGLYLFDGTHLFEYADMRLGFQRDWNSYIFDYGRNEVRAFLISNALFWLEKFHIDGLRVDAVASMLYRDYSRNQGEWIPNIYGGRENLEAISFLQEFNEAVYKNFPGAETIAEESTAYPKVSHPIFDGGLGFGQKWMMGWMNDTLNYFKRPPAYRPWHQGELTFSMVYAFSERFMLPLSHDEVVHLKASLIGKMPGDEWQRFANLRTLLGYQWVHPGTQLLFMGGEIGQTSEWSHDRGIVWELLQWDYHRGVQSWVRDLNQVYQTRPAFWRKSFQPDGYEWISGDDTGNSVLSFLRKGEVGDTVLLVVCHFGLQELSDYSLGVPMSGEWREILNSDDEKYGGRGNVNPVLKAEKKPSHGKDFSISIKLAPLAVQVFEGGKLKEEKKVLAAKELKNVVKKGKTG